MAGLQQSIQEIMKKLDNIESKVLINEDKFYSKFKKFYLPVKYIYDYNRKELITAENFKLDNHYIITRYSYFIYRLFNINYKNEIRNKTHNIFEFKEILKTSMDIKSSTQYGGRIFKNELIYSIDNYCNIYIEELQLYIKINEERKTIIPHYIDNKLFSAIKHSIHWDIFLNLNNDVEKKYIINLAYYMCNFIRKDNIAKADIDEIYKDTDLDIEKYTNYSIADNIEFVKDNISFLLEFIDYFNKLDIFNDFN